MLVGLAWIAGGILFFLSAVHVYWAMGGSKGARAAIPSRGGEPAFRASGPATFVVAALLATAAWLILELGGIGNGLFSDSLLRLGGWTLTVVFVVRSIGDFKWVGFFKTVKGTMFAAMDTRFYSPLCLFLGLVALFLLLD